MYFLGLFLIALLLFSIIGSNWPVKLWHYYRLNQLAAVLNVRPVRYGLLFSQAFAELRPVFHGQEIVIRFMEGSASSLRSSGGLELRVKRAFPVIAEVYRLPCHQQPWGDFRQFLTNDPEIDAQWLILAPDAEMFRTFWNTTDLKMWLNSNRQIEQVLFSHDEMIVRLRRFGSAIVMQRLVECLQNWLYKLALTFGEYKM